MLSIVTLLLTWKVTDTYSRLDEKTRVFYDGLEVLEQRLRERFYTSVSGFSHDLSAVFSSKLAEKDNIDNPTNADLDHIHEQLNEVKPGTAEHMQLTQEQKDLKRLAKRIVKAVKELIDDAMRKEAELRGEDAQEQLRKLDSMGLFASKPTEVDDEEDGNVRHKLRSGSDVSAVAGASLNGDAEMHDADERTDPAVIHLNLAGEKDTVPIPNNRATPASKAASSAGSAHGAATKTNSEKPTEPLSPPISTNSAPNGVPASSTDSHDVFANGGVIWYLQPFDPVGTTIHEERWTGPEVMRAMSEELSDMDEDTLTELAVNGVESTPSGKAVSTVLGAPGSATVPKKPKLAKKKGRRQQWTRSRR